MRVYAAPGYGISASETENFWRLSPQSRSIVADELQHPDSHEAVHWILRQPDPERALADALTENIRQASTSVASGDGLGDGLGKSFFKRLANFHSRVFRKIAGKKKKHRGGPPARSTPASPPSTSPAAPTDPGSSVSSPVPAPASQPSPDQSADPTTDPNAPDPSYTQPPVPVTYIQQQPPPDPTAAPPVIPAPAVAATIAPPAATPTGPYTTGTDETVGLPSASGYTLTVEGQTITNYPVDITQISSLVASGTQPGDRFEISADGVGTGLRVRTTTGFISIPDSMRAQVMAMPQGQVLALLTQAAATVAASGVPTPATVPVTSPAAAPATDNSGLFWLLGAGGVAAAAMSMGGKRR